MSPVRNGRRVLGPALALVLAAGCAPMAEYAGPRPAPGVPGTSARNHPVPGTADPARMLYGVLPDSGTRGTRTVLLYGDNRPGFRMQAQRWEYHSIRHTFSSPPLSVLRGLVALPIALVETIVPALNGPRDLVTAFTQRPTGGGEMRVARALEAERDADLVISTGDVVTDGRRGRLWADFAKRIRPLRERVPYFAAPGNHERLFSALSRTGWENAVHPALQPGRYWGALEDPASGATWVILDSDVMVDVHGNRDPAVRRAESRAQIAWADSVLSRPARFRFVVLHHPLVSAGHYEEDWTREGEGEAAENRRRLFELCLDRGVNAVFAGHEHLYQRVWVGGPGDRGFWHITTGGGGSPLYLVVPEVRDDAGRAKLPAGCSFDTGSEVRRSEYHYCRLEVPGRDSGTDALRFTAAKVSLGGTATAFDTIDLAKPPPIRAPAGNDAR